MLSDRTFRFLNVEKELSFPDDWESAPASALWRYNLHYFDDLIAVDAATKNALHGALIQQWIDDNIDPAGIGWDPYPSSLRIVNWIKWSLSGNGSNDAMAGSLALQAGFLERRIEHHLQGNHLWANAKALVFAGAFFTGPDAKRWLLKGLTLVHEQIAEQLLADGGHYERSPMYHAIVLEDMIDLVQLGRVYPELFEPHSMALFRKSVDSMLQWLAVMSFPDGRVSFFNDSTSGIAAELKELTAYARAFQCDTTPMPESAARVLADSGYIRLENAAAVLLADVGEIGPDYQPGHAHADTLSFELALFGNRLIVNSGIDQYGDGGARLYQRGTASHSTIAIDGQNSSEVWGSFRVARRAKPFAFNYCPEEDEYYVACSHDGYTRLPGKPIHTRSWELEEAALTVTDVISGDFSSAIGRFYIHPDADVSLDSDTGCQIVIAGVVIGVDVEGGRISLVDGTYHPEFGLSLPNRCIRVEMTDVKCSSRFSWSAPNKTTH